MGLKLLPPPPRRPGRPAISDSPKHRAEHLDCARVRLILDWPLERVASAFHVSERTIIRWTKLALTYDGPEADRLREFCRQRRKNRRRQDRAAS